LRELASPPPAAPAKRLAAAEFARLMAACGPFGPHPLLAVAVSGGADSSALALLAADWARARKGRVVALTVDHGLRPESTAEARHVGRWLGARKIEHRVLSWNGAKPQTGLQAAARAARYRLLEEWCRARGILHLLLAHHRGDQAETVLLRLDAGSGPFGLAGMTPVAETAALRLVRPLLTVPRPRLETTLAAFGQDWIDDVSNRDPRFARVRVRAALAAASDPERVAALIAAAAAALGRFRAAEENAVARLLARAVEFAPEGYARLEGRVLTAAPAGHGWRALAAVLATIGGLDYAPRGDAVRKLFAALAGGRLGGGRTLAGCRLVPEGERCLVVRETRGVETLTPRGARTLWDRRVEIRLPAKGRTRLVVGPLGAAGWADAVAAAPWLRETPIPYAARLSLAALRDRHGIAAIPALGYVRGRPRSRKKTSNMRLLPPRALAPAVFAAWPARRVPLEAERPAVV